MSLGEEKNEVQSLCKVFFRVQGVDLFVFEVGSLDPFLFSSSDSEYTLIFVGVWSTDSFVYIKLSGYNFLRNYLCNC